MSRPTERDHRCTDLDLIRPIREEGYRGLMVTSGMIGVPYSTLRRVVNGQACTDAEEAAVRQAWASYGPDAVHELIRVVLGDAEQGKISHPVHVKQLRTVMNRLLDEVVNNDR